jgi:ERCC4-type nuclease
MVVTVKIDTRERDPSNPGAFSKIFNSTREALPFGDAWFYVDEQLQIVCERKTASDFVGSVLGGRLAEQMRALLKFKLDNPLIPVIIVIEGDLSVVDLREVSPLHFQKEIWNWSFVGMSHMDTADIDQTVEFYNFLVSKLEKCGTVAQTQQILIDTIPIMSAGKKSQVNPENFLAVTLANINGIASTAATEIASGYSSLAEFVQTYNPEQIKNRYVGKKKFGPERAKRIEAFINNTPYIAKKKKSKKLV